MHLLDAPWLPWITLLAGLFAAVLWAWWLAATRMRRGNLRRGALARHAEHAAEPLLRGLGYRVEGRQVSGAWQLSIDGAAVDVGCRADLLVRRRRRWYVAEVKTGRVAPDPTHPATRRQLLEYRLAFDVDGILLVDMERRRVVEVAFPDLGRPR